MTEAEILAALEAAEQAVEEGRGLGGTGFWAAVSEVKRSPELAAKLGTRIADIDRRASIIWALLNVPYGPGTVLAAVAVAAGLGGITAGYYLDKPWKWIAFGGGFVALLPSTHGLAHLSVGRTVGIRFTHWFVESVRRPQPGVKMDYATYLTTPPRQRAWMHASGALVSKALPFLLIPAATASRQPRWVPWGLAVFGVGAVLVDVFWSVRSSDWKRFRRELRYARQDAPKAR
jgi:hypothetical protein